MTAKRHKSFAAKREAFEVASGRLKESRRREEAHRQETHRGYGQDAEQLSPVQKLGELRECIGLGDRKEVQQAIFALGAAYNGWIRVPDEVVDGLLTILLEPDLHDSDLAAHILNFFEFESNSMSPRQKNLVKGFLQSHGDRFTDVHSAQVVTELRYDHYLS